jgi:hypothetical protein
VSRGDAIFFAIVLAFFAGVVVLALLVGTG